MQDKAVAGPIGIPSLPVMQKSTGVQIRPATSGSSREQSDDDDLEGDAETTDPMDPADAKRARRYSYILVFLMLIFCFRKLGACS